MDRQSHVPPGPQDERSWKDIVADVVRDIENIFRNELRLAGLELKAKFKEASKAGGMLAAAGLLGFFAAACFIATAIIVLTIVLPIWLSCLIIGVLLGMGAGGAFLLGRMALQEVDPVPQRTVETMKDNIEWVKTRARES